MPKKTAKPTPEEQAKIDKAVEHIDALIALIGFDKSESATEGFVHVMDAAVQMTLEVIERSHREGSCYDAFSCRPPIGMSSDSLVI